MADENTSGETSSQEQIYSSSPTGRSGMRCDGGSLSETKEDIRNSTCDIRVRNLGGIERTELSLPPGISILVGRNATNRSSLLRSLAAVLGGQQSAARLKTDAESGSVQCTIGQNTYTREYTRSGDIVQKKGTPYSDESELVDTFVALFTDCPARRAVQGERGLREILMGPVDTAEIRSRISELKRERSGLDSTIEKAENRKRDLPALEEKRSELESKLDTVETEIAELNTVVEEIDESTDESSETAALRDEIEELRAQLSRAERSADQIEQQIEFRKEQREELIREREELEAELGEFDDSAELETKIEELEAELTQLTDQRDSLDQAVEDLQSVIQANETFLNSGTETDGISREEPVTAALDPDSRSIECWTCGTEVNRSDISSRIDTLRELATQQRTEVDELEDQIETIRSKKAQYEDKIEDYEETTRRLGELDNRIEQHSEKIRELETDYEEQQAKIDELEDQIADVESEIVETQAEESEETNEFVDTHKELTKLERKRGRLENQLEETREEIEEIEELDEKRAEAETQREELTDELESLRGRIDRLETELVETLNSIMEDLIDRLEYENIARVWLERQRTEGGRGTSFELHVVREAEDGSVYEDTVGTLSESEREVIGLVVSLAGYLVHDIDRDIPFLLIDSVEMIDGKRLAELLDYINTETEVEFLSVALLPKDAQSVEETGVLDEYTLVEF